MWEKILKMSKGCFEVDENSECPNDIRCGVIPEYAGEKLPENQKNLYDEVERTNTVIQSLKNTRYETKREYFNKLLSLAQVGLTGENAQPEVAISALNLLKEQICTREGGRIKNQYMMQLGINATIMVLISFGVLIICDKMNINECRPYLCTFLGSQIGTWLSFGARKVKLSFDELHIIEEDRLGPWIRLIFIGITSIVFMLFINSGIVQIAIGSISIEDIRKSVELQILIGTMCGLLEHKLAIGILHKTNEIISIS